MTSTPGLKLHREDYDILLLEQFQDAGWKDVKDVSSIDETKNRQWAETKLCYLSLIFYGSQASCCYLASPDLPFTCLSIQLFCMCFVSPCWFK